MQEDGEEEEEEVDEGEDEIAEGGGRGGVLLEGVLVRRFSQSKHTVFLVSLLPSPPSDSSNTGAIGKKLLFGFEC